MAASDQPDSLPPRKERGLLRRLARAFGARPVEGPPPEPTAATYVPSPCRNLCQLDPAGRYCTGCLRTREEIAGWLDMTPSARRAVLDRLAGVSEAPEA